MVEPPRSEDRPLSLTVAAVATGLALAGTALLGVLLYLDLLPRGAPEWSWRLRIPPLPLSSAALVALLSTALAALVVLDRLRWPGEPSRRSCALLLVLLVVLGAVTLAGVALHDPHYPVQAPLVVLSDLATGYYGVAAEMSSPALAFTRHLDRAEDPDCPDRVRTHPPGPLLFMWTLRSLGLSTPGLLDRLDTWLSRRYGLRGEDLARASQPGTRLTFSRFDALLAVPLAWLLTLLPALLVLPAYGLGTVLAGRRAGLITALFSLTLPSLLCFNPGIDGPGAVLALTALYLWAAGLRTGYWWVYALAGLGAALTLLWSYGYAALAPVAALLALARSPDGCGPRNLGYGLVFAAAGFTIMHGVLEAAWGYALWQALPASLAAHHEIMLREGRDYFDWLPLNPYAFALFLGPGLGLLVLFALGCRDMWRGTQGAALGGTLLALALLVLLGTTRAEVERIWVFFMPLLALSGGFLLERFPIPARLWLGALLLVAQVGFALLLTGKLALVTPY